MSVRPASRSATFFEKTVRIASAETVIAVPSDMTKAETAPMKKASCVTAKRSTRTAPLQGLSPTESTIAVISRRPFARLTSAGVGIWAWS